MRTKLIVVVTVFNLTACGSMTATQKPTSMAAEKTTRETNIARELALYVGKTIELASTDRPYQEVIKHIGEPPANHKKALANGDGAASLYPKSELFSEITFYLGDGDKAQQIVSMEFVSKDGAYDMDDLRAAFGEWHRSPKPPEKASFAVAWFPKYDPSNGAQLFLYAEDADYTSSIDPKKTPYRLFIQNTLFRWAD
ncbi:hypothetical protein AB2N08_20220 [Massilia aurea]|uniref:hypothetical protein n=1 Tax=Massilia aurea TaxID=373040 RepID=UPI003462B8DA